MATAPKIGRGYRGLEDRGRAGSDGNPLDPEQLMHKKPEAAQIATKDTHITLQASKSGRIVQLTAPADVFNPATGVKTKAKPLVLNFAAGSGFVRLDLAKEEDRRRWIYVVGSEQAEKDFAALNIKHVPHLMDGTDEIPPHPRYALGHVQGFWNVAESQARATKLRRTAILDQVAKDPEMENFLKTVTPEELSAILAKRRGTQAVEKAAKQGAKPEPAEVEAEVGAENPLEVEVLKPTPPDDAEDKSEAGNEPPVVPVPKPKPASTPRPRTKK